MKYAVRKEMKYILSLETALDIQASIEKILHKDPYSEAYGYYTIRSQYYDSLLDNDLNDNLDGLLEKRKIRTRIYDVNSEKAKLEYKCKSGSDGVKKSLEIDREQAMELENGRFHSLINMDGDLASFLYQKMERGIYRPKAIIEYDRTAFVHPVSNTRITFDNRVRVATKTLGIFSKDLSFVPVTQGDSVVFEVKFNDFLIEPIEKLIRKHGLLEMANSKYTQSRFLI